MASNKIKILFILPSLKAGGAERVISFIASKLNKQKFDCSLVIVGYKKDAAYNVAGINVTYLKKERVLHAIFPLRKILSKSKPDIVVGSISHVNRVLAAFSFIFRNTKFIGREASVSSSMKKFTKKKLFKLRKPLRNYLTYLDAIISQSNDMTRDIVSNHKNIESKIVTINNPITQNLPIRSARPNLNATRKIITVGRLSKEKGHLRILDVLAKLDIDFKYIIIGNGEEQESIFQAAKKLNMDSKIEHIEFTDQVGSYLAKSDVFVQGSYVEGFPNALLESCMIGTPVIAFNAPGGTKEIISNGENGFMVDTDLEFLEKLKYSLSKDNWMPQKIREVVEKKFNHNLILSKYESLFLKLMPK